MSVPFLHGHDPQNKFTGRSHYSIDVETIKFRNSEFPEINGNNPLCPEVEMIVVRQPRR